MQASISMPSNAVSAPAATICLDIAPSITFNTIAAASNALNTKLLPVAGKAFSNTGKFEINRTAYHLLMPNSLVVIDLARLKSYGMHILDLATAIESPTLRNRIFLTNITGKVNQSDANLARVLGFSNLVGNVDPRQLDGNLKAFTDWLCNTLRLNANSLNRLPTYLKTVSLSNVKESTREMIQRITHNTPEALIDAMQKGLDISDHSYRLKKYRQCFLGTEGITWLNAQYKISETQSVALGTALQELGLLYHVSHEQAFANEDFFYRLATSKSVDALPIQQVLHSLTFAQGVEVADRKYLGKTYEQCFIGSQAIDHLVNKWSLDRLDAWVVLHSFEQLGLLEHVTQEHGFVDGNFFYRFK
jgi:Domain found in Dishevelled, Egl-10, and Pleckstrin (DEP)